MCIGESKFLHNSVPLQNHKRLTTLLCLFRDTVRKKITIPTCSNATVTSAIEIFQSNGQNNKFSSSKTCVWLGTENTTVLIYLHSSTNRFLASFYPQFLYVTFLLPFLYSVLRPPSGRVHFQLSRGAQQPRPLSQRLSEALRSTATHSVPMEGSALSSESYCYLQQTAAVK